MNGKDIICILIAYLLGSICTGYYLVKLQLGKDVRDHGSGGVGARNVGRMLGKTGFVITLLGDSIKGLLAVALAHHFGLSDEAVALVLVVVIAGHIWPAPLGFRGGRGISTAIGAYLAYDVAYDYNLSILLLIITAVLMVFRRGFILSGLGAFAILPLVAAALHLPGHTVAALFSASVVIIFAHRERIRNTFRDMMPAKEA